MSKSLLNCATGRILCDRRIRAGSGAVIVPLILTRRFDAAGADWQLKVGREKTIISNIQ